MFHSSCNFTKSPSLKTEAALQKPILPQNSTDDSLEELKARVAVRFFVKKSKRFDLLQQQLQHRLQQTKIVRKTEPSPECLVYLGLAPTGMRPRDRDERKQEPCTDSQFLKPRLYECNYCSKVFFHKLLYRRHMIRHMRKIHWCMKCNRGFTTKISKKRHELTCRH